MFWGFYEWNNRYITIEYTTGKTWIGNWFDLRRIELPEKDCISQLEQEFYDKHTKRLLVIKKDEELISLE